MAVLDIVAERVEPDLRGRESDFGRADEPLGVIDDADRLERRGVREARRPNAQRGERGHRAGQQRGGAVIVSRLRGDEQRVDARGLQRNGAEEAGRPTADHGHFSGEVFVAAVHVGSCDRVAKD
jgi:hypothetical protein